MPECRRPTRSFGFSPEIDRQEGRGYNIDVAFKRENGAGGGVDIVAATIGQRFSPSP
jgi:hypothetical protein